MSRRELHSYRWDGTKWSITTKSSAQTSVIGEPIRIATFNVLADCFPWFVEMAIRSAERLDWLCHGIMNLNPTILGLNEVTMNALERLQQCAFIRENYFIGTTFDQHDNDDEVNSDVEESPKAKPLFPHRCIILSKLPFVELFAASVSGRKREAIVGKVQLAGTEETSVYICSHHATPYQSAKNAQLRAQQIRDIINTLEPLNHPFIIMGDLNLYHHFEDATVIENRLIDAWAQTHFSNVHPFNDQNVGYTFDSAKNSLIPYYIPGSCAQMRLDRILFSHGFPAFVVKPCCMWADERIKPDDYLFPSDHFGLFIDLAVSINGQNQQPEETTMSLGAPDPSAEEMLRHNAQNEDDQQRNRVGIVRRTIALTSHVGWLGARALGLK